MSSSTPNEASQVPIHSNESEQQSNVRKIYLNKAVKLKIVAVGYRCVSKEPELPPISTRENNSQ